MPDLELLRALAPPVEPASPQAVARARRFERRRRRPLLLATPIAVGALILALVLSQTGREPFAEAAIKEAQASPRLLVDGWTVTRVDEWDAGTGEMAFEHGGRTLQLNWSPEHNGDKDLQHVTDVPVAGVRARVGRYPGTNDFTARWDNVTVRGVAPSTEAFVETLGQIRQVDARTWLSALPASAITPRDQDETIAAMLRGIPLPPGFHAPSADRGARDRYQLGAKVAGAVVCGWIERWLTGDARAARALAGSRAWPLLREMDAEGDYPEVVWQYADAVNGTSAVPGGKPGLTVGGTYKDAFGC